MHEHPVIIGVCDWLILKPVLGRSGEYSLIFPILMRNAYVDLLWCTTGEKEVGNFHFGSTELP